jgi:hypothetical protein
MSVLLWLTGKIGDNMTKEQGSRKDCPLRVDKEIARAAGTKNALKLALCGGSVLNSTHADRERAYDKHESATPTT